MTKPDKVPETREWIRIVVNVVCGSDETSLVQVLDRNPDDVVKGQVVGQLELASCEVPMGDGLPPLCVPSSDPALTNAGKRGVDDICNIERYNVSLNMLVLDEPSNVLMVHNNVKSKGTCKPGK